MNSIVNFASMHYWIFLMITSLYTVYMNGADYKCKVSLYIFAQSIMTSHLKLLLKV